MSSFLQRMILIALILSIAIPVSIGHESDCAEADTDVGDDSDPDIDGGDDSEIERVLRDICSETKHSKQCWKIIKPEITPRFTETCTRNVTGVVFDLAIAKSCQIKDQLNQLNQDSGEDELKTKYGLCWNNYDEAQKTLENVKGIFFSGSDCGDVSGQIDVVEQQLACCRDAFEERGCEPARVRNKNKEFGYYVEIVRAATDRYIREKDANNVNARKT